MKVLPGQITLINARHSMLLLYQLHITTATSSVELVKSQKINPPKSKVCLNAQALNGFLTNFPSIGNTELSCYEPPLEPLCQL